MFFIFFLGGATGGSFPGSTVARWRVGATDLARSALFLPHTALLEADGDLVWSCREVGGLIAQQRLFWLWVCNPSWGDRITLGSQLDIGKDDGFGRVG